MGLESSSSAPSCPPAAAVSAWGQCDGGAFDERQGGVAEGDGVGAVGFLGDGDGGERGELVEQQIAAVFEFVGLLVGLPGRA